MFKYQEMERLKTEIEELEEQKTDEDLRKKKLQDNREVLDEDISSDYFDKFLEDGEKEQDVEEAMVTDVEESMEDDKECNGPEYDDFYEEFCPSEHRFKRDATEDFLEEYGKLAKNSLTEILGAIALF